MITDLNRRFHSFRYAVNGIKYTLRCHHNFRLHLLISAIVILSAYLFGLTQSEGAILLLTIVLGLVTELSNTAIESVTDMVSDEWRHEARLAKDIAAGAMLVVSIGACIIGLLLFWPHLHILR